MSALRIAAGALEELLRRLDGARVVFPDGAGRRGGYAELSAGRHLPREAGDHTRPSSPPKWLVHGENETILTYELRPGGGVRVAAAEPELRRTIVFGTPPCDTASFAVLDAALLEEPAEPIYSARRRGLGVMGMACSRSGRWCFCTSVGLSPTATKGADLMVYPDGSGFVVQRVTDRLDDVWRLIEAAGERVPPDELSRVAHRFAPEVENFVFDAEKLTPALEGRFTDRYWEELSSACVSCGICTYLCPTCHCFDIVDVPADEFSGRRVRTWDTCQFPEFTGETSAHNPRRDRAARQRQRVLHKFLYFWQNHRMVMCTGCGRCIRYCPVDINIAEAVMHLGGLR
ncbi:MAG: 4Fe-4S dicluster domain-containing protein [Thermoplasmatota archaeon]